MKQYQLIHDDNVRAISNLQANSIDALITDPPYGMDMAEWDYAVPPVSFWREAYRVMKPGSFVISFCSPEFYHRMAVNIEDGGFIPRDMIIWMVTTKMAKANRLKPAHEPIMIAQKPLEGSIKNNQEKWGCGQINIDDARVPWDGDMPTRMPAHGHKRRTFGKESISSAIEYQLPNPNGRYPSNIIGHFDDRDHQKYFYAPRVSRKERGEYNTHPTPKPISLMRYLVKIYSPIGGMVIDPFMGSGSTGIAALLEDRNFTGIDQCEDYVNVAEQRINDHLGEYENIGE